MSDLISRSALIKEIDYYIFHTDERSTEHYAYRKAKKLIERQPTVEAKPVVRGKWIDTCPEYHIGTVSNAHKCSNCGDYYTTEPEDLFFCPRCGCDMRGGKND